MSINIEKKYRQLDIEKVMADERFCQATCDIAEAVAIDERTRPLWPSCPLDQMYVMLNEWKEGMLAARDYKQGEISADMYRARLALIAGVVARAMMHIEGGEK